MKHSLEWRFTQFLLEVLEVTGEVTIKMILIIDKLNKDIVTL